jgi:hypothetical protein
MSESFEQFCDRWWAKRRHEKAIAPWEIAEFRWTELLHADSQCTRSAAKSELARHEEPLRAGSVSELDELIKATAGAHSRRFSARKSNVQFGRNQGGGDNG